MGIKEEGKLGGKSVDLEPGFDCRFHIGQSVIQGKGQLLHGRRSGFANVVPADADWVPFRNLFAGKSDGIDNQSEMWFRREEPLLLCNVFFEDVVLKSASELVKRNSSPLRHRQIHRKENGGRAIDCHGRGHLIEGNTLEEALHVFERGNRHSTIANLPAGPWIVGIQPH